MVEAHDDPADAVDRRLTQLSCEVIADPAPGTVAAALDDLTAMLERAGAAAFVDEMRALAAGGPADAFAPACQRLWRDWYAEQEVARDVAALAADPEMSGMFIAEAVDHLGAIEADLLRLEEHPGDRSLVNDVFRPFHTIKGNAGVVGVSTVQELAHKVEFLLDRCRSGAHPVGSAEVDVVLRAVDLLKSMTMDLSARLAGQPGRALRTERRALMAEVDALIASGGAPGTPAHAAPDSIPLADLAPPAADRPSGDTRTSPAVPDHTTVKVDTRKLDVLVDTVGELVILQSLLHENAAACGADERLIRHLAQLRRITTELQRGATAMRMVPIRQTFQKMARLVRDLSRQSGKPVDLVLAGEETELDRRVVEDISDPLMHMVRNSIDHGLEPAADRVAAGKREAGRLSLRAFHQGGSIVIEIADDGTGLKTDRILSKAVAQGLVAADASLSTDEIHRLIFAPGFSTAEKVTAISGRGVGMDVVRRNIDALRGRIDIQATAGQGTTFSITLPLTLAILDGLLVSVGAERFVIPTFAIRESLRPSAAQVHSVQGVPRLIQVRDTLLPLVWLKTLFNLGGGVDDPGAGAVVVLEEEGRRVGVVVDTLIGKQEVVVKSLGDGFGRARGVSGGAILGDGRIGLILDAHGIVRMTSEDAGRSPAAA